MSEKPKPAIPVAIFTPKNNPGSGAYQRDFNNEILAETWKTVLNREIQGIQGVVSTEQKKFDARVFGTVGEALHHIPPHQEGVLIFLSEAYAPNARNIVHSYPWIRVRVFTGSELPKSEPVVIPKSWVTNEGLKLMVE